MKTKEKDVVAIGQVFTKCLSLEKYDPKRPAPYEPFRHTLHYLNQSKQNTLKVTDRNALVERSQRLNRNKAFRRLDVFPQISKPLHFSILDLFDCHANVIYEMLEKDKQEYDRALAVPRHPKEFRQKVRQSTYRVRTIPSRIRTEAQAIKYVSNIAATKKCSCHIDYPELLTIFILPNKTQKWDYWRPTLLLTRRGIILTRGDSSLPE